MTGATGEAAAPPTAPRSGGAVNTLLTASGSLIITSFMPLGANVTVKVSPSASGRTRSINQVGASVQSQRLRDRRRPRARGPAGLRPLDLRTRLPGARGCVRAVVALVATAYTLRLLAARGAQRGVGRVPRPRKPESGRRRSCFPASPAHARRAPPRAARAPARSPPLSSTRRRSWRGIRQHPRRHHPHALAARQRPVDPGPAEDDQRLDRPPGDRLDRPSAAPGPGASVAPCTRPTRTGPGWLFVSIVKTPARADHDVVDVAPCPGSRRGSPATARPAARRAGARPAPRPSRRGRGARRSGST